MSRFTKKPTRQLANGADSKTHGFYLTLEKDGVKQNLSAFINITVDGVIEQYAELHDIPMEEALMKFIKSDNLCIYPTGEAKEVEMDEIESLL